MIPLLLRAEEVNKSATLVAVNGSVAISGPGGAITATVGADLPVGAVMTTTSGGTASVKFFDGTVVVVEPDSHVTISTHSVTTDGGNVTKESTLLDLKAGGVIASLDPAKKHVTDFRVRTPKGVAAARGTVFSVRVEQDNGNSSVTTMSGTVTFYTDQGEFSVSFGNVGSSNGVQSVSDAVKANPGLAKVILDGAALVASAVGNGSVSNTAQSPNLVSTVLAAVTDVAIQAAPNAAADTVKTILTNAAPGIASSDLSGVVNTVVESGVQAVAKANPDNSTGLQQSIKAIGTSFGGTTTTTTSLNPILPPLDQTQSQASPSDTQQ